jgi:pyruvate dehydrogenase (quinone)
VQRVRGACERLRADAARAGDRDPFVTVAGRNGGARRPGRAVIDIVTARQELLIPPKLTLEQIKGFTLYATRTILSGGADEIVELAQTNLRNLEVE